MTSTPTYVAGDELPSLALTWKDTDNNVIDFSTGYTFRLRLVRGNTTALEKTSGIAGAAAAPNVTVDWASGELDGLERGNYQAQLRARRTVDDKDRTMTFMVTITTEFAAP